MAYRTKVCEQGGIFNVSRPSVYSAETRTFVNDLIKESRLTTLQRKSLQGWLRSGGSGPSTGTVVAKNKPTDRPVKRYRSQRPRTLQDIVASGAYEPVPYQPTEKPRNYGAEKEKLQSIMAFGKVTKLDPAVVRTKSVVRKSSSRECTEEELVDSAIEEIEDREKFLYDMDLLHQAHKYNASVVHEIRDRIKKLEAFYDKTSCSYRLNDVRDIANKYRKPPGSPKTLPVSLSIY